MRYRTAQCARRKRKGGKLYLSGSPIFSDSTTHSTPDLVVRVVPHLHQGFKNLLLASAGASIAKSMNDLISDGRIGVGSHLMRVTHHSWQAAHYPRGIFFFFAGTSKTRSQIISNSFKTRQGHISFKAFFRSIGFGLLVLSMYSSMVSGSRLDFLHDIPQQIDWLRGHGRADGYVAAI